MRLLPLPVLLVAAAVLLLLVVTSDANGGRAQVRAIVCDVFGPRCAPALRVAFCETGGTLNPRGRGRAGERGIFQISPVHFGWVNEARLWEPLYNSRIAYRLSRGGRDWRHWTCKP